MVGLWSPSGDSQLRPGLCPPPRCSISDDCALHRVFSWNAEASPPEPLLDLPPHPPGLVPRSQPPAASHPESRQLSVQDSVLASVRHAPTTASSPRCWQVGMGAQGRCQGGVGLAFSLRVHSVLFFFFFFSFKISVVLIFNLKSIEKHRRIMQTSLLSIPEGQSPLCIKSSTPHPSQCPLFGFLPTGASHPSWGLTGWACLSRFPLPGPLGFCLLAGSPPPYFYFTLSFPLTVLWAFLFVFPDVLKVSCGL